MSGKRLRRVLLVFGIAVIAAGGGYGIAAATGLGPSITPGCPTATASTVPCVVFGHKDATVVVRGSGGGRIASLPVPAGKYSIVAKLTLSNSGSNPASLGCTLNAGAQVDQAFDYVDSSDPTGTADATLTLTGVHTFTTAGSVAISCNDFSATGTITAHFIHITAERVGVVDNVSIS